MGPPLRFAECSPKSRPTSTAAEPSAADPPAAAAGSTVTVRVELPVRPHCTGLLQGVMLGVTANVASRGPSTKRSFNRWSRRATTAAAAIATIAAPARSSASSVCRRQATHPGMVAAKKNSMLFGEHFVNRNELLRTLGRGLQGFLSGILQGVGGAAGKQKPAVRVEGVL